MINPFNLTAQEALAAWEAHLLKKPEGPWESVPVLLWREHKAMLELLMLIRPVPNEVNSGASPISLPARKASQARRRKPDALHQEIRHLEGQLMKWPRSARIKHRLQELRKREAQLVQQEARHLRGRLRRLIDGASLEALRLMAAQLEA